MICPKCGTKMRTVDSLESAGLRVRLLNCPAKVCANSMVTEERPGDPAVYRRMRAKMAFEARIGKLVHTGMNEMN
jgi:hypothetical protein